MPTAHTFVLADGTSYPGAVRDAEYGVLTYTAKSHEPPPGLADHLAPRYSWGRFVEHRLNDEAAPPNTGTGISLRAHQVAPSQAIIQGYTEGAPGFVLAYPTGSGKTMIALNAINALPTVKRVLVISPKTHIYAWRAALARHATGDTEWVVINPPGFTTCSKTRIGISTPSRRETASRPRPVEGSRWPGSMSLSLMRRIN